MELILRCFLPWHTEEVSFACSSRNGHHIAVRDSICFIGESKKVDRSETFPSAITSLAMDGMNILLGFSSGQLAVADENYHIQKSILIKKNLPIRTIRIHEGLLFCQVGDNYIFSCYQHALYEDGPLEEIACCHYRIPMEKIRDFLFIDNSSLALMVGKDPMVCVVELGPISEALIDPLGRATEFIATKFSALLRKPIVRDLFDTIPFGSAKAILSMDDPPRTISQIIHVDPFYLLFDRQYGRLLRFHPHTGLFDKQWKGLRSRLLFPMHHGFAATHIRRPLMHFFDIDATNDDPLDAPKSSSPTTETDPTHRNLLLTPHADFPLLTALQPSPASQDGPTMLYLFSPNSSSVPHPPSLPAQHQ